MLPTFVVSSVDGSNFRRYQLPSRVDSLPFICNQMVGGVVFMVAMDGLVN